MVNDERQLGLDFTQGIQPGRERMSGTSWRDLYEEFVRANAHLPDSEDLLDVPWEINYKKGDLR